MFPGESENKGGGEPPGIFIHYLAGNTRKRRNRPMIADSPGRELEICTEFRFVRQWMEK
jgi:hypothetical protein